MIEKEAHDGLDELQMTTEEQTRSKMILDSKKVEEAKQFYLCHQVLNQQSNGFIYFVVYVNCKLAIIRE